MNARALGADTGAVDHAGGEHGPVTELVHGLARQARRAARLLAAADAEQKNRALRAIAAALRRHEERILAANDADLEAARQAGLPAAVVN
ncbi:MAG TPA: hypothetical protein VIL95_06505, partial [Bacillota bacterium]